MNHKLLFLLTVIAIFNSTGMLRFRNQFCINCISFLQSKINPLPAFLSGKEEYLRGNMNSIFSVDNFFPVCLQLHKSRNSQLPGFFRNFRLSQRIPALTSPKQIFNIDISLCLIFENIGFQRFLTLKLYRFFAATASKYDRLSVLNNSVLITF